MAKRKRESQVTAEHFITLFGTQELDRIVEGQKFQHPKPNSFTRVVAAAAASEAKNTTTTDRLSRLPDEILQFITSFLTIKEGARVGILARRWRSLVSCLDFNEAYVFGTDHSEDTRTPTEFITRVNRFLQLRRASRLYAFRVSFFLHRNFASNIARWMESAANQRVTELVLDFFPMRFSRNYDSSLAYVFPYWLFAQDQFDSSLRYLTLNYCVFNFPPDFKGFGSLTSLTLQNVHLTESNVQNILSNCSSLEWLSLIFCRFLPPTRSIKLSSPSLLLKHINICLYYGSVDEIEVRDINIWSFELQSSSSISKISIENAPHLERLVLSCYSPAEILGDVPHLETLFLSNWFEERLPPQLYVFNNLKRLVFLANNNRRTNLLELALLLEACHLLQKLELDIGYKGKDQNVEKIAEGYRIPHINLKEVEIYRVKCSTKEIEFAKYLLKNAIALETMKISTTSKSYDGNGIWCLKERKSKKAKALLKNVRKVLQKDVPSSAEIIIDS